MKKYFIILILFLRLAITLHSSERYSIYFTAFTWTITDPLCGRDWLEGIQTNWAATGVQVYALWKDIQPLPNDLYDFRRLDAALDTLRSHNLDVNVLVPMGCWLPDWVDFNSHHKKSDDGQVHLGIFDKTRDFHIDYQGRHIWKGRDKSSNRFFNLCSKTALDTMAGYYGAVIRHINEYRKKHAIYFSKHRPIEIIPSINLNVEMELNGAFRMTGYSLAEKDSFIVYLKRKYPSLSELKRIWNLSEKDSIIQTWEDVNIDSYSWYNPDVTFYNHTYPAGRVDWIHFKYDALKRAVDQFAQITHDYDFKMGLQIGCLHDFLLDYRGFLDPTSLLENTDALRLADIMGYDSYFKFSANYAKSMCTYWDWKENKKNRRGFSSETNWHLYRTTFFIPVNTYHKAKGLKLSDSWARQVKAYYEQGADHHVILGWGNSVSNNKSFWAYKKRPNSDEYEKTDLLVWNKRIVGTGGPIGKGGWYRSFINKLWDYKETERQLRKANQTFHLSSDYFLSIQDRRKKTFYLANSMLPKSIYNNLEKSFKDIDADIITNYMLINNPEYVNKYNQFIFTASSKWISENVINHLEALKKEGVNFSHAGQGYYSPPENIVQPGIFDEYGHKRVTVFYWEE